MQTLTELCSQANFRDPASARAALAYARRFTERFREVEADPAARREAEMLRLQFPGALRPPQPDDRLVGRIHYPSVGISPEPGGLGWYFDFGGVHGWMNNPHCPPAEAAAWAELIRFWETRVTAAKTRAAYPPDLAAILPSDQWFTESGVGFPLYRMAGTTLDYGRLTSLGLDGLAEAVRTIGHPAGTAEEGFREGCLAALSILRNSIDWYAGLDGLDPTLRATLQAIRHQPPSTLREAIQLIWLWALHSGSWSYGRLDVVLGPFLWRDLESGRLDEAGALDLLCSFWRLMHAYANQYNNRVIIGGRGRPDEAAADRFALLAIEATRRVRLNQPQLTLRFYNGQNPVLWENALEAIGEGCTYPMLYNDDVNIPAVAHAFQVDESMAVHYTPYGCGEYVLGHYSAGTPSGVVNLLKALEIALHGGLDPLTGRRVANLPPAEELRSFEDVWKSYTRVLELHVAALARQEKIEYEVTGREASFLFISMLASDCLERGRSAFAGGYRYLGGTLETYGNSNAANSLHVIDELVFRRREITLPRLVAALDANFQGHDELRQRCLAVAKYGNDEATADAMARRVHEHVCRYTRDQAAQVGLDSYLVVIINNWANVPLGRQTAASAEGRLAGEPMANGNNPTPGSDASGATAFLNSLVRLDPALHAGAVQNMKFSREWFGPRQRASFDALLRSYFANGGSQAMITVVSREDLQSAMREPDQWGHLLVRVGGFSIRFVELPREAQLEVLGRTLH